MARRLDLIRVIASSRFLEQSRIMCACHHEGPWILPINLLLRMTSPPNNVDFRKKDYAY